MERRALLQVILFISIVARCPLALACHGQLLATGISAQERDVILYEHNRLRQLVATGRYPGQPPAQNMRELFWDDELAQRAQIWAQNCQFRHDPHRTISRFTMGQNLAIIWSTAPLGPEDGDFPSRIQSWFNEVQLYRFGDAWSPQTGHYTQMVWGETSLVGCGYAEYRDSTKFNKLYVCNYGPGGNVVGYNPYQVGKPSCASYGLRPSPRYAGLCAPPDPFFNGLSTNFIDTYEYKSFNNFNTKQSAQYYAQAASSSSYPQQAPSVPISESLLLSAAAAAAASQVRSAKAFGAKAANDVAGGAGYTPPDPSRLQHRNQLEAYGPTPDQFKRAFSKHSLLRTPVGGKAQSLPYSAHHYHHHQHHHSHQSKSQSQSDQQQPNQQTPEQQSYQESPVEGETEGVAGRRSWSLLTWRG